MKSEKEISKVISVILFLILTSIVFIILVSVLVSFMSISPFHKWVVKITMWVSILSSFYFNQTKSSPKNKGRVASGVTALILLLCFIFFSFTTIDDKEEEEGVIVSFGTLTVGGNSQANPQIQPVEEQVGTSQSEETASEESTDEEVLTDDNPESAAIPDDKEKNQEEESQQERPNESSTQESENPQSDTPTARETPEEQPTIDERALMGSRKPGDNPGTGGSADSGNAGSPNGSPDGRADGGEGGQGNSGVGHSLSGRKMIKSPIVSDNSNIEGKITVKIKVDQNGNVLSAQLGKPTTISNSALINKSIAAAKKAKFDKNRNAKEEQFGTITFTYKVQ